MVKNKDNNSGGRVKDVIKIIIDGLTLLGTRNVRCLGFVVKLLRSIH